MENLIDIEKSDGYFVIKLIDGEQVKLNVKDMQEDSPILLAVANNNIQLMQEITIPRTGFKFILLEKNVNLVYKKQSLPDEKISINYNSYYRENNVFETKELIEFGINYLFKYYPEYKYISGKTSNELFEFAKKSKDHNDYFHQNLFMKYVNIFNKYIIKPLVLKNESFVICCAPSHDECSEINNSMSLVIKAITGKYNNNYILDGSNVLYRKYVVEKLSLNNNNRSFDTQYDSLAIRNTEIIDKKNILLIDDIYTSGSTINACKKILLENGANNVILFTFGRTREKGRYNG